MISKVEFPRVKHRHLPRKTINAEAILTDPDGKRIEFPAGFNWWTALACAEAVSDVVDRDVVVVEQQDETYALAILPDYPVSQLSLPSRAIAAGFVRYFLTHKPGMRTDEPIILPKVVREMSDEDAFGSQQYGFSSEAKAYAMADIAERCFYLKATVVDDNTGFLVVVDDAESDQLDAERMERLRGVIRVLQDYDVTLGADDDAEAPEAREEWKRRQASPIRRVEEKIDEAILRLKRLEVKQQLCAEHA